MISMIQRHIDTDILIIGGGTAGCFAAITLGKEKEIRVLLAEKANIRRSGCLAAGVNALNAYITKGKTPQDYVDYARRDAAGIVREDLLFSMAERLNHAAEELERLGVVILKDKQGEYVARGDRNIKINGENIKPVLARAAAEQENVTVLNHVNITDYLVKDNRIYGACGFDVREEVFYEICAGAVICATGGAAGLYRPGHAGFSRHKMWYPPFNTGAGYAMGIRAGAEMTTFEMRFIALRCKDTIAPTGTIAQGAGARQINAYGEEYEEKYGLTTSQRVYGTVRENKEGRGPCYLKTKGIAEKQEQDLYKAYLNMAPSQYVRWVESGKGPAQENVEIEGTEPYIVGGHTASGYWVDGDRQTTIRGLFAAGDVAGGCPQKYVTGALAEGEIAAEAAYRYIKAEEKSKEISAGAAYPYSKAEGESKETSAADKKAEYEAYLSGEEALFTADDLEEAMQETMDRYAGGIGSGYGYRESGLKTAAEKIASIEKLSQKLHAADMDDLLRIYELKERLTVCQAVIAHLSARKETRWRGFGENLDYPQEDAAWEKYVNSRMENGTIRVFERELVKGGAAYEHTH